MYNYFMLIGVVEGYYYGNTLTIKLRVNRTFSKEFDLFEIKILQPFSELVNNIKLGSKLAVKGKIVQDENKIELVGERIEIM